MKGKDELPQSPNDLCSCLLSVYFADAFKLGNSQRWVSATARVSQENWIILVFGLFFLFFFRNSIKNLSFHIFIIAWLILIIEMNQILTPRHFFMAWKKRKKKKWPLKRVCGKISNKYKQAGNFFEYFNGLLLRWSVPNLTCSLMLETFYFMF